MERGGTCSRTSPVILGQNTESLALRRQASMPKWLECILDITSGRKTRGMITLELLKSTPLCMDSSSRKFEYSLMLTGAWSLCAGQPLTMVVFREFAETHPVQCSAVTIPIVQGRSSRPA